MRKLFTMFLVLIGGIFLLVGCSSEEQAIEEGFESPIQVVTSIFPMYEITKEIAGERANVSLMVGANEDAHHYEPSAKAVASVNEADVFIYSSNEMEFWVESLLNVLDNRDLHIIELGEAIDFSLEQVEEEKHPEDPHDDHEGHHHKEGIDPHFWLNPLAVEQQLDQIVEALVAADVAGEAIYRENAEVFSAQLKELDRAYREAFSDATNNIFVVQHQAFGHLADQYQLHQVAVGGLTTEVEPNPKELAEIVEFVLAQNVPVIYYQNGENSAIAETIAVETKTDIAVLYDLENVPVNEASESLSYVEAMYQNLEQLKKSIQ